MPTKAELEVQVADLQAQLEEQNQELKQFKKIKNLSYAVSQLMLARKRIKDLEIQLVNSKH